MSIIVSEPTPAQRISPLVTTLLHSALHSSVTPELLDAIAVAVRGCVNLGAVQGVLPAADVTVDFARGGVAVNIHFPDGTATFVATLEAV